MNLFKRIVAPTNETQEITAYDSWVVRWKSRHGEYSSDLKPEVEIFKTKEEAETYAEQLRKAFKLIRHKSNINVTVEPNNKV